MIPQEKYINWKLFRFCALKFITCRGYFYPRLDKNPISLVLLPFIIYFLFVFWLFFLIRKRIKGIHWNEKWQLFPNEASVCYNERRTQSKQHQKDVQPIPVSSPWPHLFLTIPRGASDCFLFLAHNQLEQAEMK